MKKQIKTATPEQWAEIKTIQDRWIHGEQIVQYPDSEIRTTVEDIFKLMERPCPPIYIVDSPLVARRIEKEINPTTDSKFSYYLGVWWNSWSGWYEGGKVLGVKYSEEKYDLFLRFNRHCPVWMWSSTLLFILRRPTEIHWNDAGLLHCDSGPSVKFSDEFCLWNINGVHVDEQIIMRPETQTLEQINGEKNDDVRTIRIDRWGWDKYIQENNLKAVDARRNDIEGTMEALYHTEQGGRLVATCPSGRIVSMGVTPDISTCQQAQAWLAGDKPFNSLART